MEMTETINVAYYTCVNKDCEKYRGVFRDGDSPHQNCERERLWLEGQRAPAFPWPWIAGAALVIGIAAAVTLRARNL